mgnify:FL=1
MKVTFSMLHPDLQQHYKSRRFLSILVKVRWLTKLTNLFINWRAAGRNIDGLNCEEVFIPSSDGSWKIRIRIYKPLDQDGPLPILLYFHGGGYILGNPEMSGEVIKRFIATRPCVIIAPDYRKAYTEPYPAGFNDCYETLLWAVRNADRLDAKADQIIVAGHSAGGGLVAAVTLKARDTREVDIAFQMPIYPMIDDQQPNDPSREIDAPIWNTEKNRIGWNAYLAGLHREGTSIPNYAAAGRNQDYKNFPPTITFVGTLEPFYWETKAYVKSLRNAGVEVCYREFENCFHGFDGVPNAPISKAARDFTFDSYQEFYDRYI